MRFFRPLWRRVVITGIVAAWTVWEWAFTRDQFWGVLTLLLLGYALYTLFYAFPKEDTDDGPKPPG